jgi:hypothetical protein
MPIIKNLTEIDTTGDGLAAGLGISRRWVYQLVNEGIIQKTENNKFNVGDSTRRYCEYLRSGNTGTKADTQAEYWQEKTKHENTRQEMAAIKLAKLKNQLHDAADVERVISGMLVVFRSKILAIPAKVSLRLANKESDVITSVLSSELREALTELSEYDPAMFNGGDDIEDNTEDS